MNNINLLIINWLDKTLYNLLKRSGYRITYVPRGRNNIIQTMDLDKYDLIYYAKFVPPYIENLQTLFRTQKPFIHATHAPFFIQHFYRPINYLYEAIMLSQLLLFKTRRNIWIHSLNSYEYSTLLRLGYKTYYIPLGVDTREFSPKEKFENFTLMFAGARYQKGADLLKHIISGVIRKRRSTRFILVGNDFLNKDLRTLHDKYPGNVEIYDYLPRKKFIDKLCRSHILLFPSRYEGCPKILLEALSCRDLIVGFKLEGLHSLKLAYQHGIAILSEYPKLEPIIRGIITYHDLYYNDRKRYDEMVDTARRIAELFDWKKLFKRYDRMFREVKEYYNHD